MITKQQKSNLMILIETVVMYEGRICSNEILLRSAKNSGNTHNMILFENSLKSALKSGTDAGIALENYLNSLVSEE